MPAIDPKWGKRLKPFLPPLLYDWLKEVGKPADFYRQRVGGEWEEIGRHQLEFMRSEGLQPEDTFLDVGCGALRGGVHFIEYLEDGQYYGVDKSEEYLQAGREIEMPRYGLDTATVHLAQSDNFDFAAFDETFDYALAQSLFTHLPWNKIVRCLLNVTDVLASGGRFYASFFETDDFTTGSTTRTEHIRTSIDSNPYHYPYWVFESITGHIEELTVEYLGDWGHPRGQHMLRFVKQSGPST